MMEKRLKREGGYEEYLQKKLTRERERAERPADVGVDLMNKSCHPADERRAIADKAECDRRIRRADARGATDTEKAAACTRPDDGTCIYGADVNLPMKLLPGEKNFREWTMKEMKKRTWVERILEEYSQNKAAGKAYDADTIASQVNPGPPYPDVASVDEVRRFIEIIESDQGQEQKQMLLDRMDVADAKLQQVDRIWRMTYAERRQRAKDKELDDFRRQHGAVEVQSAGSRHHFQDFAETARFGFEDTANFS